MATRVEEEVVGAGGAGTGAGGGLEVRGGAAVGTLTPPEVGGIDAVRVLVEGVVAVPVTAVAGISGAVVNVEYEDWELGLETPRSTNREGIVVGVGRNGGAQGRN